MTLGLENTLQFAMLRLGFNMEDSVINLHSERWWVEELLRKYNVSWQNGFVSDKEPLLRFPDPYFACWDEIFGDLTRLMKTKKLCDAVDNMPLLDHTKLGCYEEWRRAHLVLAILLNGYVWQNGENHPMKIIPQCLAIPLVGVANYIGGCPILSYCNAMLTNWRRIKESRPLELSNMDTLFSYTGNEGERWFCLVTLQVELEAAPGIRSIVVAQKAVAEGNDDMIQNCLLILRKSIERIRFTLERMYERCDPGFFYTKLRLLFAGSKENKSLPNGLIYEGVSTQPLKYYGGSAAQSSVFQTFDAALGVEHPRKQDGEPSYLESILDYMPRQHREFILCVKNGPSIKEYIEKTQNCHLQNLFNDCVKKLAEFRCCHIQVVARYVTIQAAKKENRHLKMLAEQGAGGTGLMRFLKEVRDDTRKAGIDHL